MSFFRRAGASASSSQHHRPSLAPDFGAFDDEEEDDEASAPQRPMLGRDNARRLSFGDEHRAGHDSTTRQGAILLNSTVEDPLTSSLRRPNQQAPPLVGRAPQTDTPSTLSLPGSYDFEPQGHEGAPVAVTPRVHAPLGHAAARPSAYDDANEPDTATADSHRPPHRQSTTALSTLAQRLLPQTLYSRLSQRDGDGEASSGLLFSQDEPSSADDTDTDRPPQPNIDSRPSYPPRPSAAGGAGLPSHVPLPARAPQFAAPRADGTTRVFGGGQNNDGVFANLSAKPDNTNSLGYVGGDDDEHKDEILPAYEVAALDSTPPYWETTVITPGGTLGPDDICVDGLPVGNLFGFAWNLLVSMSFQFVDHPELFEMMPGDLSGLDGATGPQSDDPSNWSWWGGMAPPVDPEASEDAASATLSALGSLPTQIHGALGGVLSSSNPGSMRNSSQMPTLTGQMSEEELVRMSTAANEWMAFMMITLGSFLIVGAVLSYWRAVRWARAVRAGQGPQSDQESLIGRLLAS
ncbi:hypothetical protein OIV83_000609 [Microbotryomycetes sp. JL201]|nr:hypothetical protein OIV83_000609 [Microbotryomycetes sp. JL201]